MLLQLIAFAGAFLIEVMEMAEYIERESLRDALYDADAITMSGVKILNQFPAADVAPVRH